MQVLKGHYCRLQEPLLTLQYDLKGPATNDAKESLHLVPYIAVLTAPVVVRYPLQYKAT